MTDSSHLVSSGSEKALSRKQKEAIPFLVGARSLEEGCRRGGMGKGTLFRWLKQEAFKAELERQREAVRSEALQKLKMGICKAVDGLTELSEAEEKNIKLKACQIVLDFFFRNREIEELEGRLEKIERIILEKRTYRQ